MAAESASRAYSAAREFLYRRIDFERAPPAGTTPFKLARMRRFLECLGNPQSGQRIIHIAGTKGKGSTAAMVSTILSQSGRRTGLYTSPHLETVEERLAIDGLPCPTDQFARLIEQVRPIIERLDVEADEAGDPLGGPTFFEILTAVAFLYFAQQSCDATVLEVGLGGRLDSTNVCQPDVTVITTISLDHTRQLGDTLAAIAAEKAGIIKPAIPVVCGVTVPEPLEVIQRIAADRQSPLVQIGRDFGFTCLPTDYGSSNQQPSTRIPPSPTSLAAPSSDLAANGQSLRGARLDYDDRLDAAEFLLKDVRLAMRGEHQALNAAVAIATIRVLERTGWTIAPQAYREGLSRARCPARVEVTSERPTIILDAAHNVASTEALAAVLRKDFVARRRTLVFAVSRDKDVAGMLRRLIPEFDRIVLTEYRSNPRAMPTLELLEIARALLAELTEAESHRPESHVAESHVTASHFAGAQPAVATCELLAVDQPIAAWQTACNGLDPDDLVCIAGSFFLAAELRSVACSPCSGLVRK